MLALPLTVGTILLSKRVILIIYGGGFLPSVQALNVLIVAEFFVFVDTVLAYMLLSIDRERVNMFNAGVGAAVIVVLNLFLIPRFGLIGAAIATVITQFYFFVAATYALSKAQYNLNFAKIILRPLLATLVMGAFVYHFSQATLFMLVPTSAVMYFLILYLTKYISAEDIALVKQMLRTR
jgi:O-antigen/teichoic acid export membrane protein